MRYMRDERERVLVIQEVLNSNSGSIRENPTVHDPIPSFSNHILLTHPSRRILHFPQRVPPPPPQMRHLRPHQNASTPKRRRRFAHAPSTTTNTTTFALSARERYYRRHHRLSDVEVDFRRRWWRRVDDFLDFLGDDGGEGVVGFVVVAAVMAVAAAGGEAEGEDEEGDNDEGADEDADEDPQTEAED